MRGNSHGQFAWAGSNPGGGTGIDGQRIDARPATSAVWSRWGAIAEQLQLNPPEDVWSVVERVLDVSEETIFDHGANVVCAGSDIIAGWLSRVPGTEPPRAGGSATWGKLPDGCWLLDVSANNGWTALCPDYSQGRNIELRDRDGEIVRTIPTDAITTESAQFANVRFGYGVIAFITAGQLEHVHDLETGNVVPFLARPGVHYVVPLVIDGILWLFERTGGEATAQLSMRRAHENIGIVVATTNAFEPDAVLTDIGIVACGWMSEQGATPERFRRADIDVKTAPMVLLFGEQPPEPPIPPTHDHAAAIAALTHAKADIDRAIALLNQEQKS